MTTAAPETAVGKTLTDVTSRAYVARDFWRDFICYTNTILTFEDGTALTFSDGPVEVQDQTEYDPADLNRIPDDAPGYTDAREVLETWFWARMVDEETTLSFGDWLTEEKNW